MFEAQRKRKRVLIEIIFYISIFLFTYISYMIFKPLQYKIRNGVLAQTYMLFSVVIVSIVFLILKKSNRLNHNLIILYMILISYFIHLCYMLYTPYDCRQYDTIVSAFDGHEGYAWTIFTTGKLPTTNNYQFYHPPLNAFIQALFMKTNEGIIALRFDVSDIHTLYQSCQMLSVLYSMVIIVFGYKILKLLKLDGKGLIFAFSFICFFPRLIQLSAQLNNDLICIMFCFLTIYFTLKWKDNMSYFNTVCLALSIGFAMMSKISGAIICVTPALIFIINFYKICKTKNKKKIINICLKFTLFFLICFPLGLWFQIYAKIRFNQPLGYVFDNLNPELSTAHHSFFERFLLIINFDEMFSNIYCLPFSNYGVFNYIAKSAIFGEFNYWQGESFAIIAFLLNYIFIFTSIALFIRYFKNSKHEDSLIKLISCSIIITQLISMLYFNLKMPYGCTMDFRYIVPIIIGFAILLGASYNKFHSIKKTKYFNIVYYITLSFLFFSNLFYFVCI